MKISPVSTSLSPGIDSQAARIESIRSLKMATNATPEQPQIPAQEVETPVDIVDNDKSNAVVEATEPLSPQFAALAKQRRALQQERRAFEDQKKAQEAASQGSDVVTKANLKSQPLKTLLDAGVTYDQLTEEILANQDDSKFNSIEAKIAAIEQGVDKKLLDRDAQAEQQVLAEMKREAESMIAGNDDFELVRETNSVPDVMKLIERTYRESGEVLDVSEALKLVEEELFKRNQKLIGLKKFQGLIKPSEPVAQQRPQGMRTLTNRDTASPPMTAKQRALAAFAGTLKK